MIKSFPLLALGAAITLGIGFLGCSTANRREAPTDAAFASPSEVAATLVNSSNIDVTWKNNATESGGVWVEFTTPGSEYVKLAALWPDTTRFQHPDVAPDTKHIYRILPFFGRPTEPVTIMTGAMSEGTTNLDDEGPLPSLPGEATVHGTESIRRIATIAAAAPAGLTATLASPTTVDLRWKDRARDEDGFLMEVSADRDGPYQVCALLDPNTTSFRKTHLPPLMKIYFRVRAFFYGKPSAEASVTTPAR